MFWNHHFSKGDYLNTHMIVRHFRWTIRLSILQRLFYQVHFELWHSGSSQLHSDFKCHQCGKKFTHVDNFLFSYVMFLLSCIPLIGWSIWVHLTWLILLNYSSVTTVERYLDLFYSLLCDIWIVTLEHLPVCQACLKNLTL